MCGVGQFREGVGCEDARPHVGAGSWIGVDPVSLLLAYNRRQELSPAIKSYIISYPSDTAGGAEEMSVSLAGSGVQKTVLEEKVSL